MKPSPYPPPNLHPKKGICVWSRALTLLHRTSHTHTHTHTHTLCCSRYFPNKRPTRKSILPQHTKKQLVWVLVTRHPQNQLIYFFFTPQIYKFAAFPIFQPGSQFPVVKSTDTKQYSLWLQSHELLYPVTQSPQVYPSTPSAIRH